MRACCALYYRFNDTMRVVLFGKGRVVPRLNLVLAKANKVYILHERIGSVNSCERLVRSGQLTLTLVTSSCSRMLASSMPSCSSCAGPSPSITFLMKQTAVAQHGRQRESGRLACMCQQMALCTFSSSSSSSLSSLRFRLRDLALPLSSASLASSGSCSHGSFAVFCPLSTISAFGRSHESMRRLNCCRHRKGA